MAQHHKLVCGLFVLSAVAQAGCAGSGLKNIFTRNETTGYQPLDDIDAEEIKPPSAAARLASWRPFSKAEPESVYDDAEAANDPVESDAAESGKKGGLLGRAFSKGETIDPDPFLDTESRRPDRQEKPALNAASNRELAGLEKESGAAKDKLNKDDEDFLSGMAPQRKSPKNANVSLPAEFKEPSAATGDDENLTKRFEQHFLSQSNPKSDPILADARVTATADEFDKKTTATTEGVNRRKRDLSSIAERQIHSFDELVDSDDVPIAGVSGIRRSVQSQPSRVSKANEALNEAPVNSLAAFDSLLGTESSSAPSDVIEATHNVSQTAVNSAIRKTTALQIDVDGAESLFGAAESRQKARAKKLETAELPGPSSESVVALNGGWTPTAQNDAAFQWYDAQSSAPARRNQANSPDGSESFHAAEFGAPPSAPANSDFDENAMSKSSNGRISIAPAFGTNRRIVVAEAVNRRPGAVIIPASSESLVTGESPFTVAPAPEPDSSVRNPATANRPGLLQSFSTRNWLLLFGGIIVIALLFAPGRTKSATVTSRPANG